MEMIYQDDKLPFYSDLTLTGDDVSYVSPGAGNPTVSLYNSSGAIVGAIENVAVTGKETGEQATLTCWYVVDSTALSLAAGDYRLVFKATIVGDEDGIQRTVSTTVDIRVLAVLDPMHWIYNVVRAHLGKSVTALPDTDLALQSQGLIAVTKWMAKVPCLTGGTMNYSDVPASGLAADKTLFDTAVGLAIAAKLLRNGFVASVTSDGGQGMIIEETVGPTRIKYAGGSSTAKASITETAADWEDEIPGLLDALSCVKQARMKAPAKGGGGNIVGLAGNRRGIEKACPSYYRRRC